MYFETLEDIAQTSAIRTVAPSIKWLLGLGAILLSVSSTSIIAPLLIAVSMSLVTIFIAKTSAKFYGYLLMIPVGFAIFSVVVIMFIRISGDILWTLPIGSFFTLTLSTGGIDEGLLVLARVFGGMCSLFFVALTIPFTESFVLAKKCRIPDFLIELTMFIYRSIFILLERASTIYTTQVMRLGYSSPHEAINSFGMMAGSLFISSLEAGEHLSMAMDARCYDGKFAMLEAYPDFSFKALGFVTLYLFGMGVIVVLTAGWTVW